MREFSKRKAAGLLITGAAIGAAATILLAPKTGIQMRKDLRRLSRRTLGQLDDLSCDIRGQIGEGYEQVKRMFRTA